jgi:NADH-quinone oxidoreductase subunit L
MSAGSFAVGLLQLSEMLGREAESRPVTQKLFTWISVGSFNVDASLLLDQLSICFVLLITGVGTLIHIYSISYMSHDPDRRRFFAYLNLFIAAMLLLVLGDSYLNQIQISTNADVCVVEGDPRGLYFNVKNLVYQQSS